MTSDTQQQLIRMIEHWEEKEPPERTMFQQISLPPQQFTLSLALVMVWFLLTMVISPFIMVSLTNPWIYAGAEHPPLVYYTFQIPVAILVASVLGRQYGLMVILLYLILGFSGLPFFANGGGLHYIHEASVGYLMGFVLVPFAIHRLLRHGLRGGQDGWFQGRSVFIILAAVAGVLAVHLAGLIGLISHGLAGTYSWGMLLQWAYVLTTSRILYDMLFSVIAVTLVRFIRLIFSLALY